MLIDKDRLNFKLYKFNRVIKFFKYNGLINEIQYPQKWLCV